MRRHRPAALYGNPWVSPLHESHPLRPISYHGVFNVGSGEGRSLNEPRVVLDISAARATFGWAPAMALKDGIARTWRALGGS